MPIGLSVIIYCDSGTHVGMMVKVWRRENAFSLSLLVGLCIWAVIFTSVSPAL